MFFFNILVQSMICWWWRFVLEKKTVSPMDKTTVSFASKSVIFCLDCLAALGDTTRQFITKTGLPPQHSSVPYHWLIAGIHHHLVGGWVEPTHLKHMRTVKLDHLPKIGVNIPKIFIDSSLYAESSLKLTARHRTWKPGWLEYEFSFPPWGVR